jgi:hypothetical protein
MGCADITGMKDNMLAPSITQGHGPGEKVDAADRDYHLKGRSLWRVPRQRSCGPTALTDARFWGQERVDTMSSVLP